MVTLIAIAVGIVTALILFKVFFDDLGDFLECVRFWITPDIISAFRGEWDEDQWSELKLFLYLGLSIGSGLAAHYCINRFAT